jgi:hypothetical protein
MPEIPTFEEYVASLGQLTAWADPTIDTDDAIDIRLAAASLATLDAITLATLTNWVAEHPEWVSVLGLAVGLSREKLKVTLKHHFKTASWASLARSKPAELVTALDQDYDLVRLITLQRLRAYDFGDVLVARSGTRRNAVAGAKSGRALEDKIEAIAKDLDLPYETRTRFVGRHGQTGPCDLVIPTGKNAAIAVAAKAFGSSGSKQSAAWKEVEDMANVRKPSQFIMAVIDGIGWESRLADLRRIYDLWAAHDIDGMYTVASLDQFRSDLEDAARRHKLL